MSYRLIILIFLISLSTINAYSYTKSSSLGLSETMGIFGVLSNSKNIHGFDDLYLVKGVFPIPILGGIGLSLKNYYSSSRSKPFTALTMLGTYTLGLCGTDNCDPLKMGIMLSWSLGYDFHLIKSQKINMHLKLGILSQFDLIQMKVFESPSDKPEIWPIVNLSFNR
tara:strand:+ start:2336 stop:2836 length:501 start_codon:yes stop_codon:yes gene_type:complete